MEIVQKNKNAKNIKIMTIMMFFIMLIYNMGHPATPGLIELRGLSKSISGVFLAAMSLTMFLSSPYLGAIADQIGKKKVFVFLPLGYGLSQVMFALTGNLPMMILSRLFSGIFAGATYSVAYGYVSDISERQMKSANIAKIGSIAIIGGALGAKIGGQVAVMNTTYPFILQLILSIVVTGLLFFFLKDTEEDEEETKSKRLSDLKGLNPFSTFKYIKELDSSSKFFVLIIFMSGVGIFSYNSSIIYFLKFYKNVSSNTIGTFTMLSSLLAFLGTSFLLKWMLKKHKEISIYRVFVTLGILIMILSLVILEKGLIPYVLFSIYTMSYEIVRTLGNSILANRFKRDQGKILGIATGMGSLGMAVGSLISGYLLAMDSYLPFIVNIVMMSLVIGLLIYNNFINTKK
ncbi:MAG: MFS transporter [Leptotrichiaceae bacterium]|jgi:DHA1 family multidrug resistance protein-like MFS transporter|nr:MFS transporter [Leptotrichiaceae bacterium]MBP6168604.1 MFS transporter [Leptotrichiaceae bacterium]MBP7027004.1 MFS transporter [Leptotrichiaceae bacterium]MBP9539357.1 MFS transporter [Leptotrichiaceae bacterium]